MLLFFFLIFFRLQQQSARYFSPHDRSNSSPTTGNLTVLNASSAQCYTPLGTPTDSLLHRPSCLTCPTISGSSSSDHCVDHPTTAAATTMPPHTSHFHPFHATNMPPHHHHHNIHNQAAAPPPPMNNKNFQHGIYGDSCQK